MEASLKVELHVLRDIGEIGLKAAETFVELAKSAVASKGRFAVALSGGATPQGLYSLLATSYRDEVPWGSVHIFWGDERCVPKEHEESNFRVAYESLLSKIDLPGENIHRMRGDLGPEAGAREYEEEIRRFFGPSGLPAFDLILLGMGEDGHTASLFPGSKALEETERLVAPVYPEGHGRERITLTLPVLNNATHIVFLVSGSSKAEVLSRVLGNGERGEYPAGLVRPLRGSLLWLVDRDAARDLKPEIS